jgi:hypothetical protein
VIRHVLFYSLSWNRGQLLNVSITPEHSQSMPVAVNGGLRSFFHAGLIPLMAMNFANKSLGW